MGAVVDPREEPLLIMEYMENGKSDTTCANQGIVLFKLKAFNLPCRVSA
jgi:hypothetical protein